MWTIDTDSLDKNNKNVYRQLVLCKRIGNAVASSGLSKLQVPNLAYHFEDAYKTAVFPQNL